MLYLCSMIKMPKIPNGLTKEQLEYELWYRKMYKLTEKYSKIAKSKGFINGKSIFIPPDRNYPVRLGHGFVWSDSQNALVSGCSTLDTNDYLTAVPIYDRKLDKWGIIK